jgi:putative ABC transport system substrate-binding protein
LEILREIIPSLRRIAFIGSSRDPNAATFLRETERSASALGMVVQSILLAHPEELEGVFEQLTQGGAEALVVQPILVPHREKIASLALRLRLPTASSIPAFAEAGILISYGANVAQVMQQAASYVDKVMRGQKPGELPVQHASQFDLVINLKTARALGLEIPPTLVSRANEVIE